MNVQNPETKDKNLVEEKQGEPDLAVEKYRELTKGEITFADIEDENLLREIHERFTVGEEEIPEAPEMEEKETPEAQTENKEVNEIPQTENAPSQEYLQERKKSLDELNTIKQRIESSNKELERINKLKTEKRKVNYEDPLSEDSINSINKRLNEVENREQTFYEESSTKVENEANKLKEERLHLELQLFQSDANLKLSKPLKTVDAQYKRFLDDVGGVESANEFFKNEKFRATKEGEGVSFAISDSDFKKYKTIVEVYDYKQNKGYPTFSSAFADYSQEMGIAQDNIKQAVLDATTETVEQMTSNQNMATTLSPDDGGGSGKGNGEMTDAEKASFLMNMPVNPTPAQERQARAIHESLMKKKG